jgi:Cu-processing system ATP-binding protein
LYYQELFNLLSFLSDTPPPTQKTPSFRAWPNFANTFKKIIQHEKEKGKTILVKSHIISFIEEISDDVLFLLEVQYFFKKRLMTWNLKQ